MPIDIQGMLDEAEQLDEEANEMTRQSLFSGGARRVKMQQEAKQIRVVARGIRNEANGVIRVSWERAFVSQAQRILTRPQFEMIKAAADVHSRGTE